MIKNNQGITLIELIVVILILGILAGGALFGFHSLDSGNANSTVKRISALLDYVRVENMSRDKTYYLVIEENSGTFYATVQYDDNISGTRKEILTEKLKLKDGTITYTSYDTTVNADSSDTVDSDAATPVKLEISYNKEAGDFRIINNKYVKQVVINAVGHSYTIHLVRATGKHYIE